MDIYLALSKNGTYACVDPVHLTGELYVALCAYSRDVSEFPPDTMALVEYPFQD